jgi:glycosyltransferase involved in cell wall biosynthesis
VTLPVLLKRCEKIVGSFDAEVILVDNGSTDETPILLKEMLPSLHGLRSIRITENQGYGYGILEGLRAARGEILGWTHADMQTDPLDALRGMAFFERYGPDIFVKGRRFGRPLGDVVFTVGMSLFESVLLRKQMWDINAQPTMFSRSFFYSWSEPPHDYSLDLFVYYEAKRISLAVHRFPVLFGERTYGVSHWNVNWLSKRKFIRRTLDFSFNLMKRR